jgi:ribosome-binding factor A
LIQEREQTMEFSFKRKDRLESEIQKEAMTILMREVTDPRIGFVTVTRVEMTGDLREVRIFVSVMGDAAVKKQAMEGLASATGYVRYLIGQRVQMKFVPTVQFRLDETLEKSVHVMDLFHQIERERRPPLPPIPLPPVEKKESRRKVSRRKKTSPSRRTGRA